MNDDIIRQYEYIYSYIIMQIAESNRMMSTLLTVIYIGFSISKLLKSYNIQSISEKLSSRQTADKLLMSPTTGLDHL